MKNPAANLTEEQVQQFSEMGYYLIDVSRYNNDPIELSMMDDCWHRGEVTVYAVRNSNIRIESRHNDQPGDFHHRLMDAMVKAGMIGNLIIMDPAAMASFGDSARCTPEAIAAGIAETKAMEEKYSHVDSHIFDGTDCYY